VAEHSADKDAALNGTASAATTWNGGICGVCAAKYLGSHTCSVEGLLERSDELRRLAMEAFERLNPQPTVGPDRRPLPPEVTP
jgi:hypothetical protein